MMDRRIGEQGPMFPPRACHGYQAHMGRLWVAKQIGNTPSSRSPKHHAFSVNEVTCDLQLTYCIPGALSASDYSLILTIQANDQI